MNNAKFNRSSQQFIRLLEPHAHHSLEDDLDVGDVLAVLVDPELGEGVPDLVLDLLDGSWENTRELYLARKVA